MFAPEVRQYASQNMTAEHRDANEREVCHLHIVPCSNMNPKIVGKDMEEVFDLFWDEFKCFEKKTKSFDNIARWNSSNAIQGSLTSGMTNTHHPTLVCLGFLHVVSL